ncbi:MAG: LPS export ABC transporter periplasmic protein LptC [Gammaproteobacteria bacterium]|nr:LPS export ABC transporter periplasmic protein LptC [Gammaproteobacteria bacterium]MBT8111399.1 LPS export ABC transporter periplasmic protein LptC [Gammaproteobacteria bacterium]NND48077.1 LPS export ABC transporter periplasmic protein LptC [Woeseiaceae bacterium]NNL46097.1 LPS export ABC transporter periplasmic protein LptC [Woeseiaceae bacterium]
MISPRNAALLVVMTAAALGSWYLARSDRSGDSDAQPYDAVHRGYYLKSARILGTGENGDLLYEIDAERAEQQTDKRIEFTDVRIRYSPGSAIPWTVNADAATLSEDSPRITLRGHVRATSNADSAENETEIRTQYLELDPERFVAETDQRVQIRIGARSLTATGMLASLNDDRIELKSNVRGKIAP